MPKKKRNKWVCTTGEVKCRLCGQCYQQLTQNHLRHIHNIDLDEYKNLFPDSPVGFPKSNLRYKGRNHRYKSEKRKVICKLCGKGYRKLTDSHLQSKHGMTHVEYLEKYPDAETHPKRSRMKKTGVRPCQGKDKIRCRLCDKCFRQVTGSHLENVHGITTEEYLKRFPKARTQSAVSRRRKRRAYEQ